MKYIKLFENFNKSEIDSMCRFFGIKNYSINSDGSIDVNGNIDLAFKKLTEIPLKFNRVSGNFICWINKLTNLEGSPNYVGGDFDCSENNLISLDGCPKEVGGYFVCSDNPITPIINLFDRNIKTYLEYQETYNFLRKDCKIIKHRLIEALNDFNEYYNQSVELPEKIEGYTYI